MMIVIALGLGLVVGSIINVLADELPARRRLQLPHYPDGTPRRPSAWLGLVAFLTEQRASPADPDSRLSWRHPITELATGLGFAGIVFGFADEKNWWAWLIYYAIMVLVTVIDVEHRLILFVVMIPSFVFAILVAILSPETGKTTAEHLYGGLAGFGVFFIMFLGGILFVLVSRHKGVAFGFGDVMLATLSGLIVGWKAFIVVTWITVFAGAAGSLLYLIGQAVIGRKYKLFTPLPYGPYIVIGTLAVLFFGEQLKDLLWAGSDFF